MESITTKQFSILSDHMAVYQFLLDIFSLDRRGGVPAPFWEYALCSGWMDKSFLHRCGMWLDGEKIVGFCFHENPVTDVYFSLRPGYEALAPEMVAYGGEHMPRQNGEHRLVIFESQTAIRQAAPCSKSKVKAEWKFSSTFFKRWWGVGGKAPKVATLRKERISQERQKRAARKGKGRGRA